MEGKICNCKIPANLQKDMMYEKIREYIAAIDPELCADDTEYENRLKICSRCNHLIGGLTCAYCGCFVLARAKKKAQKCPDPKGAQW
ncbi:MAG: hypothetical protein E7269_05990 [Lachnospiraceae bacterium]|nr:hypothetical protein [Lachnospiraceae bacterium]